MTVDERISRYLSRCAPAVSGRDGHNQTFSVACALVNGFGLDEHSALEWLLIYNAGCDPPWSNDDLKHKVKNALDAPHRRPRGYLLNAGEVVPVYSAKTQTPPEPKPVYDPAYLERFTAQLSEQIDDQYLEIRSEFTCHDRTAAGFLHKVFKPGEYVWVTDKTVSRDGYVWTHDGPIQNLAELNRLQTGCPSVWFLSNPVDGQPHQLERLASDHNVNGISFRAAECVID